MRLEYQHEWEVEYFETGKGKGKKRKETPKARKEVVEVEVELIAKEGAHQEPKQAQHEKQQ